ncbi:MAG: M1 family peptidase, partial [bacterium]
MRPTFLALFGALAGAVPLAAQVAAPPAAAATTMPRFDHTGVGDTSIFAPLDLPPGNEYRAGSGAPGPKYWQNHADYDIKASLD